jgi:hypothetical protein
MYTDGVGGVKRIAINFKENDAAAETPLASSKSAVRRLW